MKRFLWTIGVLAVLTGAGLLAAPHLLPRDLVKTRIAEQISAWTGRAVSLNGEPVISLFPRPIVRLNDVRIAGPEGMADAELVWMESLTGSIRLLPLVVGLVEIESFEMVRPRIRLVRDEAGRRNWTFDSGAAALQLAFAGDVRLGEFLLEDGEIIYEDRAAGRTEKLQALDLALDWPSVRQPLALSGTAVWRGENVALQGSAREPFEFLKGGRTPVEVALEAKPVRASLQGEADNASPASFAGNLTVESPSLRGLLNWIGKDLPPGSTLASMGLSGTATLDNAGLSVDGASFSIDGNNAAGALQVAFQGTPHVSGTLAFPTLDLGPYFEGLRGEITANEEDWARVGIDTDWFRSLNSDIRLSAERLSLGRLALSNAALSVLLKDGRLGLGLAQAGFYGGTVSGTLSLTDAAIGPTIVSQVQLRASDFNLSEVRSSLGIAADLSGLSTIALDLKTAGETLGDLVAGLEGTVTVGAARGTLPPLGLDAVAAALRTGKAPAAAVPGDATAFERLQASVGFADQAAFLQQAALDTAAYAAVMSGQIALRTGAVALQGALSLAGSDRPAAPFIIDGTLRTPTVSIRSVGGR